MPSPKQVRFNELIMASDYEVTYLNTDDELESVSSGSGESKEGQRWSLTEGLPPSLPIRTKSPAVGRRTFPRGEYNVESMLAMSPSLFSVVSPSKDSNSSSASNTPIQGSLEGEMAKIAIRDIKKLPRLALHDDTGDDSLVLKGPVSSTKPESDDSERSVRSMIQDVDDALGSSTDDHWSPLRSDEHNDYSLPMLPRRRGSGDALEGKLVVAEHRTLSTLPNYDEDEEDEDSDEIPPLPFYK